MRLSRAPRVFHPRPGYPVHMPSDDREGRPRRRRGDSLRYMAILRAGHDFGLTHEEMLAIAGPFRAARPRCEELADALADIILARATTA